MAKTDLTAERLRELLHYDPLTGVFTRKIRTSNRINIGDVAGNIRKDGYRDIRVGGEKIKEHRVAWLYVYGEWPKFGIDHINGNPSDNRIANLRDIPQGENVKNVRQCRTDNAHGSLGVARNGNNWRASIQVDKVRMYLGTFKTPELACAAYIEAKRKFHNQCTI